MEPGTVAEWFGAVATVSATVVALYLGVRDDEARRRRAAARHAVHLLAEERLRVLARWRAGIERPDQATRDTPAMDRESRAFFHEVRALGRRRQRRGLDLLRTIYGDRSLQLAELARAHVTSEDADFSETLRLLMVDPHLVTDGEPGPLRRRAAEDAKGAEAAALERAYRALANL